MAPVSIPAAASALQQISFGLNEKVGRGKLLGFGEMVNPVEPENTPSMLQESNVDSSIIPNVVVVEVVM